MIMSQWYGSMKGSKGEATRQGTKKSGMTAHIRGWDIGVYVNCFVDDEDGKDTISIYKTRGSNNSSPDIIGMLKDNIFIPIKI